MPSDNSQVSVSVPASAASDGAISPLLVMDNISKAYPGVLANDSVSLSLHAGSIHAL